MPGSPRLIFRNLTDAQLFALQAAFLDRALNGSVTSLSGQNHSSQLEYADLENQMMELNYEMGRRGIGQANLPQKIYQQFNDVTPNTANLNLP